MRIAICDDEKFFRNSLKKDLEDYAKKHLLEFAYSEFSSGELLLSSNIEFDLIFMDYQMDKINGIDTVGRIRNREDNTTVIFISSYKEMVFDSMEVDTYRFLIKPINLEKLHKALDDFIKKYHSERYVLLYNEEEDKICRIAESSIIYAEADNIYSKVRTAKSFYKFKGTLSKFEHSLKSAFFYRTHRSYVVNFNFINSYTQSEIRFENNEKACLTKTKFSKFQKSYIDFLKKKI